MQLSAYLPISPSHLMDLKQDGEEGQLDCLGLATLPGILLHSEACPVPTVRITSLTLACSASCIVGHCCAPATMAFERAEVDSASPFRSVKEAVAVYGDRCHAGNASSRKTSSSSKLDIIRSPVCSLPPPKPVFSANSSPPSLSSTFRFVHERDDELRVVNALRKLEAELYEAKREVKLLKEMQSETKVAVAALCLQLQKSMSKTEARSLAIEERPCKVRSDRWGDERIGSSERLPTLAQALSLGRMEDELGGRGKTKVGKRRPLIPLIGDLFPKRKTSSDLRNTLCSPSFYSVLS
ncbi:hypothetical protein B296_00058105 [Ensete ventricosum]|uniref:Uncharacterized protein n=1 Tax=Ensete ventricosum TaxID=4639 RepID=A0A426XNG8_ENSVE|nr:hypothetical protein B296_00058105 [Ensete ventricosum]